MAKELSAIGEQSSVNNDHIIALYENMETLMSGFQLVLNVITKHDNLINNFVPNSNTDPVICETDILVGAYEDISAISNVVPINNDITNEPTYSEDHDKMADTSNTATHDDNHIDTNGDMFDDSPSIAGLSPIVDPVYFTDSIRDSNITSSCNSNLDDSESYSESESGESDFSESDSREALQHLPYEKHDQSIFNLFNLHELDKSTKFDKHFDNRSLAYYGELPYSYSNFTHKPKPYTENVYLTKLLTY